MNFLAKLTRWYLRLCPWPGESSALSFSLSFAYIMLPCNALAQFVFWAKAGTRNNENERSVGTRVQGSYDRSDHVSLSRCMYRVMYYVESQQRFFYVSLSLFRGHPTLFRLSSSAPLHYRGHTCYLYFISISDFKIDSY